MCVHGDSFEVTDFQSELVRIDCLRAVEQSPAGALYHLAQEAIRDTEWTSVQKHEQ
jgi:hypothetical protein